MARLFSGEDSTFSSLLAYFRKLENDNLLHIINVQRGRPCVKGSRKARMKDYGCYCLHNCISLMVKAARREVRGLFNRNY